MKKEDIVNKYLDKTVIYHEEVDNVRMNFISTTVVDIFESDNGVIMMDKSSKTFKLDSLNDVAGVLGKFMLDGTTIYATNEDVKNDNSLVGKHLALIRYYYENDKRSSVYVEKVRIKMASMTSDKCIVDTREGELTVSLENLQINEKDTVFLCNDIENMAFTIEKCLI